MRQYIRIEIKRFFHTLPGFLLSVFTVTLFTALLLLLARYFLPEVLEVSPFRVGLCVESDDMISSYVNDYIMQMESAEGLIEWREVLADQDFEKVGNLLEEKELTACIIIPERTAQSIMDGTNIPVQVIVREGGDGAERYLQERLLTLLTECGAVLIDVPQAETLLLYEIQAENPGELGETLDLFHFGLVFGREDWFETELLSAFGSADTADYYLASGLTLLFLFWGLGCGSFFRRDRDDLPFLLERRGVMLPYQQAARQGIYIVWHLIPFFALFFGIVIWGDAGGNAAAMLLSGVLCAGMLALQGSFFFELAPTMAAGTVLNVIWGLAGFLGAGGILPAVFLPETVTEICGRLPAGICMRWLMRGVAGKEGADWGMTGLCLLWCLLFGAAGQLVFWAKQKKYR